MKNYMDSSYVVVDNTVVVYSGQHATIKLPPRFADIEILKIGNGSFMESSNLQCIILPPKIKEIGSRAFCSCPALTSAFVPGSLIRVGPEAFGNCRMLRDITVYNLYLSAEEYRTFKAMGKKCRDGVYVLREIPQKEIIQKLVRSITNARPASNIPDDVSLLFQLVELDEQKGKFSLDKNVPIIGFDVLSLPTTENIAFINHIKNGAPETYYKNAEHLNDQYVRVGYTHQKAKTIIFTFDDTNTKEEKDGYLITATLKIGYFFWQSAQPIIYEKKKYYIYRRYYLNSDANPEYVRRDIAVYSEDGLVTDREEAQNVYAKYKLMSIL